MTFKAFIYEEEKLCLSVSDKGHCSILKRTDKIQILTTWQFIIKQNVRAAKTERKVSLLKNNLSFT